MVKNSYVIRKEKFNEPFPNLLIQRITNVNNKKVIKEKVDETDSQMNNK